MIIVTTVTLVSGSVSELAKGALHGADILGHSDLIYAHEVLFGSHSYGLAIAISH
jgi:hypothetical protein